MFKKLLIGLFVLVVLAGGVFAAARLSGLSEAQHQALQTMREPLPAHGENAFAHLWLLAYDVPPGEMEAVMTRDAARWQAYLNALYAADEPERIDYSVAQSQYPSVLDSDALHAVRCVGGESCLAQVAGRMAQTQAFIAQHAAFFSRLEALRNAGYYQSPLPADPASPLPAFQDASALTIRHAFQFLQGQEQAALSQACEDFALWRRMAAHGENLIVQMIGIAYAGRQYGPLIADMLARMPADTAVPASCQLAFAAPSASEANICTALKGEFQMFEGVYDLDYIRQLEQSPVWINPLTYQAEKTRAI
jgi:hypothetical protein